VRPPPDSSPAAVRHLADVLSNFVLLISFTITKASNARITRRPAPLKEYKIPRVGVKKGRAVGINFPTMEQICRTLSCQPGDVLKLADEKKARKKPAAKGG
jgi:hypothetical protein